MVRLSCGLSNLTYLNDARGCVVDVMVHISETPQRKIVLTVVDNFWHHVPADFAHPCLVGRCAPSVLHTCSMRLGTRVSGNPLSGS
jgi:hypothetical protein